MSKVIQITAVIIAWFVLAIITYGIMRYADKDNDMDGDEAFWMGICLAGWPICLIIVVICYLCKKTSNLGELVAGFLYGVFKKKDD